MLNSLTKEKVAEGCQETLNGIVRVVKSDALERLAWCLVAIGFCWTEVGDYHLYIFLKQMYIMIGIGTFYCIKKGALRLKKLPVTVPIIVLTVFLVKYCNDAYFFGMYFFYNTSIPILAAVTVLLYILAISECFEEKRMLRVGEACILMLLFAISVFLSVNEAYNQYILVVITMLPYAVFLRKKESQRSFVKGIADGLCIGVWVVQGYSWKHRPYNAYEARYSGATTLCIYAGRIYLLGFSGWLAKYVELAREECFALRAKQWLRKVLSVGAWLVSACILAIVYMTGNRGTVVAMVVMALAALVVRYMSTLENCPEAVEVKKKRIIEKGKNFAVGLGKVTVNLVCLGCVSLMLFPIVFNITRWLPAYFNEPDYLDSCGNRFLSRMTQEVGEPFIKDNEYCDVAVKKDDDIYSIKYITYYECLCFNIGRLIPGMNEYFYEKLGDEIWETKANRIESFYEAGYYSEEEYNWYWTELNESFEEQYVGGSTFADIGDGSFELPFKEIIYDILSAFLLYLDAESEVSEQDEKIYPGDTKEYPWSTRDALQNGLGERAAIYSYAIRHFNLEGHKDDDFAFYQTEDVIQGHAHNVFLQAGYDFGVIAMVVFALMFIVMILIGSRNIWMGHLEYICPVILIIGFAVFGMFDVGFKTKNGITAIIILIAMCIRNLGARRGEHVKH